MPEHQLHVISRTDDGRELLACSYGRGIHTETRDPAVEKLQRKARRRCSCHEPTPRYRDPSLGTELEQRFLDGDR